MVFLAGPRQAGKTTLAKKIASEFKSSIYLTYDHLEDRRIILDEGWLPSVELIILDEIHIALRYKFLKIAEVIKSLKKRPASQHVILTGRGAARALIKAADLVTEMKCVKHPFQSGIRAQLGIEF